MSTFTVFYKVDLRLTFILLIIFQTEHLTETEAKIVYKFISHTAFYV